MTNKARLDIVGASGLKQFNGYVLEEFLPELRGPRAVRLYREMQDNDSTVNAVFYTIKNLGRHAPRKLTPAPGGQAEADFVQECMDDMSHPFDDLISEIFSFLTYGWSYFEKVYKIRGGPQNKNPRFRSRFSDRRIGWRKFALRSQDSLLRWEFDDDGGLRGMWQLAPPNYKLTFLPIEKALLFRTELFKANPEGRSMLRGIVIDYFYKKRIQETEAIGISRDMTGLVTMEVPQEMLASDAPPGLASLRADLERMLSSIHRDQREFAMIPPEIGPDGAPTGYKLKLLSSGGRRQMDTSDIITRYNKQIAMAMMSELVFMGNDKSGSYALSKTKSNMMGMAIGTMLTQISNVFNQFAIPELLSVNGMDITKAPTLSFGKVFAPDPEEIASYIAKLAAVKTIETGKELSDKLLEIGDFPKSETPLDENLIPQLSQAAAGTQQGAKNTGEQELRESEENDG